MYWVRRHSPSVDHVQPGLLLEADGEPDAVVQGAAECVGGQLGPAGEQVADGLRAGERADGVGVERRERRRCAGSSWPQATAARPRPQGRGPSHRTGSIARERLKDQSGRRIRPTVIDSGVADRSTHDPGGQRTTGHPRERLPFAAGRGAVGGE